MQAETGAQAPAIASAEVAAKLTASELALRAAQQELGDLRSDAAAYEAAADAALARQAELQAMLSVVFAFVDDNRDLVECRASEALLRSEIAAARAAASGGSSTAEPRSGALRAALWQRRAEEARAEAVAAAAAAAATTREAEEAREKQMEAAEMFADAGKELDHTGAACDKAQTQNAVLLKQLEERDLLIGEVRSEHEAVRYSLAGSRSNIHHLLALFVGCGTQQNRTFVHLPPTWRGSLLTPFLLAVSRAHLCVSHAAKSTKGLTVGFRLMRCCRADEEGVASEGERPCSDASVPCRSGCRHLDRCAAGRHNW